MPRFDRKASALAQSVVCDLDGQDSGVRTWEVAGIEEATIRHFSSRDAEIREAMAALPEDRDMAEKAVNDILAMKAGLGH